MNRQCGSCTLCCKLLPVRSLGKPNNQRCQHQRAGRGCAVHHRLLSVSPECAFWTCSWLTREVDDDFRRPDRAHYVVDAMPDYVDAWDDETGQMLEIPVVQVWVDPDYPDAHRDPALRAWLERRKQVALIRSSASDAFVLFPPSRMKDGQWVEKRSNNAGPEHSAAEVLRVLGEHG